MATPPRVFVTRRLPGPALDRLRLATDALVWPETLPPDRANLIAAARGCSGLLTLLSDRIDAEVMDAAGDSLRVISNYAVGFNNLDVAEATRRGIAVGNTPDVLTDATADLAVALLLAVARHVHPAADEVVAGQWRTWEPTGWLGCELAGRTLGIVGMGRIGEAVARRLVGGWEMKLLYTAGSPKPDVDERLGGRQVALAELLAASDFVSLHVPSNDATRNMINAAALDSMRPSAILINTARGEIVDQEALVAALDRGRLAGAGLDVTTPEPLGGDHPLVKCRRTLVLPHIGSATTNARQAMTEIAVDNLLAGLAGQPLRCPVRVAKA